MPLRGATSKDTAYFDALAEAGANILRGAKLLEHMFDTWPEDSGVARDILKAEQEGDRITQDIVRRLNIGPPKGLDSAEIYALATQLDDIIDDIEEAADFMGLFAIEAPMEQAHVLSNVLAQSCEQVAGSSTSAWLQGPRALLGRDPPPGERGRPRLARGTGVAVLQRHRSDGGDPLEGHLRLLERAIDSTETAAHKIEAIAVKHT